MTVLVVLEMHSVPDCHAASQGLQGLPHSTTRRQEDAMPPMFSNGTCQACKIKSVM
jgi:hypothetical protein